VLPRDGLAMGSCTGLSREDADAVLAAAGADVGLVAYEMAVLVKRVGDHLAARSRPERNAGAG
jgi:hypothetical protein